jgi:hypothetical protein
MNWDAIGAVGELVGAMVVAVTLVFLIRQIKQNTESLKIQARIAIAEHQYQSIRAPLESPRLLKAAAARGGISEDMLAVHSWCRLILRQWETAYSLHLAGVYDSHEFQAHRALWRAGFESPATPLSEFWADNQSGFSPGFRAEVNQLLASKAGRQRDD